MDSPENLLEKEYHFDEGLGQTLDEHVEELKQRFPGVTVQTRRDRDGFAIIKTMHKREYKYDLDQMEAFDAQAELEKINESIEVVLGKLMPGSPQEIIDSVSQNMENIVQSASTKQGQIDTWSKLQIQ